jgi:hypothetical protein
MEENDPDTYRCLRICRNQPKKIDRPDATRSDILMTKLAGEDGSARCDLIKLVDLKRMNLVEIIYLLLSVAIKFADFLDERVEGSRPDNKIQSPRSPRSAPIDEG